MKEGDVININIHSDFYSHSPALPSLFGFEASHPKVDNDASPRNDPSYFSIFSVFYVMNFYKKKPEKKRQKKEVYLWNTQFMSRYVVSGSIKAVSIC